MDTLLQDIRHGLRMLLKHPGFTIIAVICLALGIGANTIIFSVVNAVLLRSLPYQDADRLAVVWETNSQQIGAMMNLRNRNLVSPVNYQDWNEQNHVFEGMAAARFLSFNLVGVERPERIPGAIVTANLFSILNMKPILGRAFLPEDAQPGRGRVVVLSRGLWERRFGSDPNVIGQNLVLNNESFSIIGVMPADFQYPEGAELWALARQGVPDPPGAAAAAAAAINRGNHYMFVIGRLKPGVPVQQAQTEMDTIGARLQQQYPATNSGMGVRVVSMQEELVGDIRPALMILLGVVAFVLLIACANVANLLLARSISRQREISIRTALGAGRARIVRQLLTESIVLGLIGGVLGLLLAYWGVQLLVALSPEDIPRVKEIGVDGRVVIWTFIISLVTGLLSGLAPALQTSKSNPHEVLKESDRGGAGGVRHHRLRSLLVVSEIALTMVLLTGAGLLVKSFLRLQEVNPGFKSNNVVTMRISLPGYKYSGDDQIRGYYKEVLGRLRNLPGVDAVAATTALPLTQVEAAMSFSVQDNPSTPGSEPIANWRSISPEYFRVLGTPVLTGRAFTEYDGKDSPNVVIINESMARSALPGAAAVGKRLLIAGDAKPWEIVGVVGDIRHTALDQEPKPEMYVPFPQAMRPAFTLTIHTTVDPSSLIPAVRNEVQSVDKDQPLYNIKTLDELRSESIAKFRFNTYVLAIFSALALIMAAVGLYGVMAYSVSQRTRELGIRMALGAQPEDVRRLVVGQGMRLALIGIGLGLAASLAVTRVMSSLLYGVTTTDTVTFISVALTLAVISLLASYIPARKATRVNPIIALRYE
jgi:putative ABC transport system permease protein